MNNVIPMVKNLFEKFVKIDKQFLCIEKLFQSICKNKMKHNKKNALKSVAKSFSFERRVDFIICILTMRMLYVYTRSSFDVCIV